MRVVNQLAASAYGMHIADQIALVAVPLVAALAFDAPAQTIGLLVACQSMAHLVGSIPFGLIVDRADARAVALAAATISTVGFAAASASIIAKSLAWFAIAVTASGFGIVLFVLVGMSIVPKVAAAGQIASANSRIEIPRAVSSFAIPLAVGIVVTEAVSAGLFAVAAVCAFGALCVARGLPRFPAGARSHGSMVAMIIEGGRFVLRHELLLPIALCAVFWNFAFAALLVVMVPVIVDYYLFEPGTFGIALSAFGLAAIAGSWAAGRFAGAVPPNVILLFGPGSSIAASAALLLVGPESPVVSVYAAFFLLGFGPSMWLIAQNSIRQLVTPAHQLGRVNAMIQTAVYGIRPVGALAGGAIAGAFTPQTALLAIVLVYAVSFTAALFSRLRSVRRYADLAAGRAG